MMPKNSEKNGPGQEMSCLTADYGRLRGMQRNLLRSTGEKREKLQAEFAALLEKSHAGLAQRQASLPKPEFQADLPVNERRAEIAALIKSIRWSLFAAKPARARRRSCRRFVWNSAAEAPA
jgi:hypothetical protein